MTELGFEPTAERRREHFFPPHAFDELIERMMKFYLSPPAVFGGTDAAATTARSAEPVERVDS